MNGVSLKETDSTTLLNTLNTITVNVEEIPSDKSLYEEYKEKTDKYNIETYDVKFNSTFIEILYLDDEKENIKGFQVGVRNSLQYGSMLQFYSIKENPNKYYSSKGYPVYRKFFDIDEGKDYINDRNLLVDKYTTLFETYSNQFLNLMISEFEGVVQPTIDPSKLPVRVDYILSFCESINTDNRYNGEVDDNSVANKINEYVVDYLIKNEILFINLTVEKIMDSEKQFNISYKVDRNLETKAKIFNEKLEKEYELFDAIYDLSKGVYDSCSPPYSECSYSLPDYVFKVSGDKDKFNSISPTGSEGVKYITRCSNDKIDKQDDGSFIIPNEALPLSVCRITCYSERHTNRSTSFTVRVKENIEYKPSIDVSKVSKPVMVYANQQFEIRIPVTCPSLLDDEGINTQLEDVRMDLEYKVDNDQVQYSLVEGSKLSDRKEVSKSCEQVFTFILNFTSNADESSVEMKNTLKINITSDKYDMKHSFDLSLIKQSIIIILFIFLIFNI